MSWCLSYQYWWEDGLLLCSCCGSYWSHVHSSDWHHHSSLLALMKHPQCRASLPADPEPESWDSLAGAQISWEKPPELLLHCCALHWARVFGDEWWRRKKRPLPPAGYTTPGSASEMSVRKLFSIELRCKDFGCCENSEVSGTWGLVDWRLTYCDEASGWTAATVAVGVSMSWGDKGTARPRLLATCTRLFCCAWKSYQNVLFLSLYENTTGLSWLAPVD